MPIEKARAIDSNRRLELKSQLEDCLRDAPASITLEIGCGHGHFLTAYAAAHPQEYCIGVDIIEDRLVRAERKLRRAELTNVNFVRADAIMLLETLPESVRVNRIFVLFPDPWPKRKHHKNRLIQPHFLELLAKKADSEAKLYFRTDHDPYFKKAHEVVAEHPDWDLADATWPFEYETVFQERAESHQSWIAQRAVKP
tara:strand:+ start:603 stop:1196 length:594 start_codon:yes stop_codon:yes gene_type:complete